MGPVDDAQSIERAGYMHLIRDLVYRKGVDLTSGSDGTQVSDTGEDTTNLEEANVITSGVRETQAGAGTHKVLLDIDMPALLVPSSTQGHSHLYIEHYLKWDDYVELLTVLAKVGVIERGYADSAIARGYTSLRPPWVHKETAHTAPPAPQPPPGVWSGTWKDSRPVLQPPGPPF